MKPKTHLRRGRSIWTECGRVAGNVIIAKDGAPPTCQRCQRREVPARLDRYLGPRASTGTPQEA